MKKIPNEIQQRKIQNELNNLAAKICKDRGADGVALTVIHKAPGDDALVICSSEARKRGTPLYLLGSVCSQVATRMGIKAIEIGEVTCTETQH